MVAYLTKSDASEGFNQIINFLNGSYIKYVLTVNPNIYVSCIKQFWNTVAIKEVNDVTRLHALVDKKKVVVTEAAIREVLRLDDAEGVDCLPNEEIFTELARMGYEKPSTKLMFYKAFFLSQWKFLIHTILQCMSAKRTSWNEFSSSMASAVICLSTGDLSTHTTKYASPTLTQKVFANMRRVGKGFSRVDTPLFEGMLVSQEIEEEGDANEHVEEVTAGDAAHGDDSATHKEVPTITQKPSIPSPTPPTPPPQTPQDLPSTSQTVDTSNDIVMDDKSNHERMIAEMDKDDDVVLMDDKEEDKKVEEAKVVESAQVQGRQAESQAEIYKIDMDHANKVLSMHEAETEPSEVQEVVDVVTTAKLITEVVTAVSETVTAASVIIPTAEPQVPTATLSAAPARVAAALSRRRKGMVIRDPEEESTTSTIIPETKSKDKGKEILAEEPKPLKKKQQIEMDKEYARKLHAELNKDIDWDVAIDHVKLKAKEDPATKEQMEEEENKALKTINETPAKKASKRRKLNEEVEDLKSHLEIMPNEDDNVYTKATPLARKNFSDDLLLTTLGAMFEKPDTDAQIWKNQRTMHGQAKVKNWKLLESCDQMLNTVRLQVEEESEVSLELLRFIRQQHQEGQLE
nr:hypothetical protein [Tanacetum cinerariifolium]